MLTSIIDPYANSRMTKRADNSVWEAAAVGVEYISPNQHGRIHGDIYRRYYAIPDGEGTGDTEIVSLGFTVSGKVTCINGSGVIEQQAGDQWYCLPHVDFGSGSRAMEIVVSTTNIELHAGSLFDWQAGGYIYIDYTKA